MTNKHTASGSAFPSMAPVGYILIQIQAFPFLSPDILVQFCSTMVILTNQTKQKQTFGFPLPSCLLSGPHFAPPAGGHEPFVLVLVSDDGQLVGVCWLSQGFSLHPRYYHIVMQDVVTIHIDIPGHPLVPSINVLESYLTWNSQAGTSCCITCWQRVLAAPVHAGDPPLVLRSPPPGYLITNAPRQTCRCAPDPPYLSTLPTPLQSPYRFCIPLQPFLPPPPPSRPLEPLQAPSPL